MTITLPLPPPALHAHAKGQWYSKTGPTRSYRELAMVTTLASLPSSAPYDKARMSLMFFFPDDKIRDLMNISHGCKPAIDGIVDAGLILDDNWKILSIGSIDAQVDRDNPRVELTFEEMK